MFSLSYASQSLVEFEERDLAALMISSRAKNHRFDVTGLLIYRNGRFIQVLEGRRVAVMKIFQDIAADSRHRIQATSTRTNKERYFADWSMRCRLLSDTTLGEMTISKNRDGFQADEANIFAANPGSKSAFDRLYIQWLTPSADDTVNPAERGQNIASVTNAFAPRARSTDPDDNQDAREAHVDASNVVTTIYNRILSDVDSGALLPGDRVNDKELAELFGISRTPVREALQRLRTVGVVEASAGRFTRIAVVDAEQAAESIVVIAALFHAVLDEVIGHVSESVIDEMRRDQSVFDSVRGAGHSPSVSSYAAQFYVRLVDASTNNALRNAFHSALNIVKLGSPYLDRLIGLESLAESQSVLLAAVIAGDIVQAKRSIEMFSGPGTSVR